MTPDKRREVAVKAAKALADGGYLFWLEDFGRMKEETLKEAADIIEAAIKEGEE